MCDQIAAQILADKSALNATSADGKIGGLTGPDDDKLLNKEEKKNVNKAKSWITDELSLLPSEAGTSSSPCRLNTVLSLLHFHRQIRKLFSPLCGTLIKKYFFVLEPRRSFGLCTKNFFVGSREFSSPTHFMQLFN